MSGFVGGGILGVGGVDGPLAPRGRTDSISLSQAGSCGGLGGNLLLMGTGLFGGEGIRWCGQPCLNGPHPR